MLITFDQKQKSFILQGKNTTYIIKLLNNRNLAHIYWGKKIASPNIEDMYYNVERCSFSANVDEDGKDLQDQIFTLDTMPNEYPSYGTSDLRMPAVHIQLENGSRIVDFRYDSYEIVAGKPPLRGLPSVYAEHIEEATTLHITLKDAITNLKLILSYSMFADHDVVIRSARLVNEGNETIKILRALSMSMDFADYNYDIITLSGSWARERHLVKRPVVRGTQSIESRRGASGHSENPFMALVSKNATETTGEAYGFSFVYSGNFLASVEVDQYDTMRVSMGINPFDFSWKLEPEEEFITPEVVMAYSSEGIGNMSRTYHNLYRNRLARGKYRNQVRPIVINNWEATYFDFNADKIINIAKQAKELGMEMMVLDDGWFGHRDSDNSSLGDWYVDKRKLPDGIGHLAEEVTKLDMKFGLWFEPEMISPDSNLYQTHPDWCLHVPERHRSLGRNQLVLDYSREDVQKEVIKMLSEILGNAPISYVKWDMNRNMTEIGSAKLPYDRQAETAHRYILGLYHVLEEITSLYPDVLFESCSGGGGRFDPGMLYYMPQNWTSDDTDGVERLKIQYGTSMVYPSSVMTAHVSAVPNHQTGRIVPLSFRGHVAMAGNFGYELDVTQMSLEEKEKVKEQIAIYKEIRPVVQFGDFYRLLSPFEDKFTSWMYVTEDKSEAVVFFYKILATPNAPLIRFTLEGLNPEYHYSVSGYDSIISGEQMMNFGLNVPSQLAWGDFTSMLCHLKAIDVK
jgi:alpha-galactosidase